MGEKEGLAETGAWGSKEQSEGSEAREPWERAGSKQEEEALGRTSTSEAAKTQSLEGDSAAEGGSACRTPA